MIPHSSTQRPLPRPVPTRSAPALPLAHPDAAPIDPRSQNAVIDLTETEYGDTDAGRPSKRLRLDTGIEPLDANRFSAGEAPENSINPLDLTNAFSVEQGGRPPWSFRMEMPRSSTSGVSDPQWPRSASLPPLPIRPWKYGPHEHYRSARFASKDDIECKEVSTTPYRINTPSVAPRFPFPDKKPADFYPWTGSHPEDVLTDQTTKQGFYDRVQINNECNSARSSLYPQFKHTSGLKVLSAVLAVAIEKRQAYNQVNALTPSSFRPPPRVTLTDIKREAWLRDLANPSVPLRKLSRTIPHGIRGKVLLDQCLGKSIPIGRAIWLAKCVGANELRAFKRKGTSAGTASSLEAKWVRDWTISVQQFVEGVIVTCGDAEWKIRMSYAMRLSGRLFIEHLIEQDHFLDWFLTSLDAASFDSLPVWLLMTGIYWKHLVRYRKRGKRFAECLLEKLRQATDADQNGNLSPLIRRLSRIIKTFALAYPSSFILPQSWTKYERVLSSCLDSGLAEDITALQKLKDRNARVCRVKNDGDKSNRSPHQRLTELLDSSPDFSTMSAECLNISRDYGVLITKIIEWASTSFRHGLARTYIAVRLFRKWKKTGVDIDSHILAFLMRDHQRSGVRLLDVYHVICELVRSQSFSVGKYLQWLMARGVVSNVSRLEQKHISGDIELLAHLPTSRLPSHISNLRNTLLSRTGFSIAGESTTVQQIKASLRRRLPNMFTESSSDGDSEMTDDIDFPALTWTVRSEIGTWIRDQVASYIKTSLKSAMDSNFSSDIKTSALTAEEFFDIRYVLESLDDLSMLADVLKHSSGSDDVAVLASAVDTLNYHFNSFNAIGATSDLFRSFTTAYVRISKTELALQDLITSLLDVGIKLPTELSTVSVLRRDLAQRDRKLAMPASSPVSDHIADTLNTANPTFTEELDQLLASGNSMDEPTMVRVFDSLSKRLQSGSIDGKQRASETARYFAQLRTFNAKLFDHLMIKWVILMLKSHSRPSLSTVLPPLVGVGCVTFQGFYALTRSLLQSDKQREAIPDLMGLRFNMLKLVESRSSSETGPQDFISYRFRIFRQEYTSQFCPDIISTIQDLLAENTQDGTLRQDSRSSLDNTVLPLLCELIVRHPRLVGIDSADRLLDKYPACYDLAHQALGFLLGSQVPSGVAAAEETIESINDFSLPFCLMKLRLLFNSETDAEVKRRMFDLVFEAAKSNVHKGLSHWVDVVGTLHADAAQEIRQRAEEQLLSIVLSSQPMSPAQESGAGPTLPSLALVYLRIVEDLSYSIPDAGVPSLGPVLVEKLNTVLQRIVAMENSIKNMDQPANRGTTATRQAYSVHESILVFWFSILLRLTALHRSTFPTGDSLSKTDLADQSRLLISICCITFSNTLSNRANRPHTIPSSAPLPPAMSNSNSTPIHVPQPQSQHTIPMPVTMTTINLQTQALDVAATLADSLPDDFRHQCTRFLRDRCPPFFHPQNNPHLLFLLGPLPDAGQPSPAMNILSPSQPAQGTTPTHTPLPSTPTLPAHLQSAPSQSPSQPPSSSQSSASPQLPPAAAANPAAVAPGIGGPAVIPLDDPDSFASKLRLQKRGKTLGVYPVRPWEMLEENTPVIGLNDTAVNLGLFGARIVRG
ncbi:RNA polymerase II mediator complex subunit [Emmonsiellopsis sp. PD_33]|nr:RNA polymerase II mediator complex subunit [Emmonsiellopsis sp. PD_33]